MGPRLKWKRGGLPGLVAWGCAVLENTPGPATQLEARTRSSVSSAQAPPQGLGRLQGVSDHQRLRSWTGPGGHSAISYLVLQRGEIERGR